MQSLFTALYDRAGYDYDLDYQRPPVPPLSQAAQHRAQALLEAREPGRRRS